MGIDWLQSGVEEQVIHMIQSLPEDVTVYDIIAEVQKRMSRWLTK